MRAGRFTIVAIAALLGLATPALAAPGTLTGHADFPFEVRGAHTTAATDAAFAITSPDGDVSFSLDGVEGRATRVVERAYPIVDSRDPTAQVLWQQRADEIPLDLAGATLTLASRDRDATFQLLAYDGPAVLASRAATPSDLTIGSLSQPRTIVSPEEQVAGVRLVSAALPFGHTIPQGRTQMHATAGTLTMDEDLKLFVSGATMLLRTADGKTMSILATTRDEQHAGRVYDPLARAWIGGGSHTERVTEYLVIDADTAHLHVQFAGLPGRMYAERPTIQVDGEARLPRMLGTVTVTDKEATTSHALRGEDLLLAGRFTLTPHDPDTSGKGTKVDGTGDLTTVSYGSVDARYDWATAIAAVGIGAAALAAIAWVAANGKTILGLGGGGLLAGYARVHGDGILEHPGRAEVYERVKAFPGVNFVQLSEQVEFGTSTLNYHLRVLEKNGFVTSVRDGRYLRFFDRKSGHYSNQKKFQVSALRNPQTAAIAQHIRANPGVAQCDLATTFGVTASTVTWHINRLAQQGLVTKTRDAHRTRYYVGASWANLPLDEQVRQDAAAPAPLAPLAVATTA